MKDLEFFRNLSVGQYVDSGSRLHRFGAGTKSLWLLALSLLAIAAPSPLGAGLPFLLALAIGKAAGVRPGFLLRGLKPALPVFAFAAALQFLFAWPGDASLVLVALGPLSATAREAYIALMVVVRTASMIVAVGLFTALTPEGDAARAVEEGLAPLARLGLPVHRLALAVATAIRFVPIVAAELESVVKAQASRGARFGASSGGPLAKARAYLPLFVPVTVRALERAELLAEAMEARCYSGEGRSRRARPEKEKGEGAARAAALLLGAAALAADALILAPRIRPF